MAAQTATTTTRAGELVTWQTNEGSECALLVITIKGREYTINAVRRGRKSPTQTYVTTYDVINGQLCGRQIHQDARPHHVTPARAIVCEISRLLTVVAPELDDLLGAAAAD